MKNLAVSLFTRYNQLGGTEDLDGAIVLVRDLHPQGHLNRSVSLTNLALHLFTRYEQLGGIEDLDEAIVLD